MKSEKTPTTPAVNGLFRIPTTFIAAAFMSISLMVNAQTADTPVDPDGEDPGWPREYEKDGHQVVMYQPQVDSWKDYALLEWKSAIAVKPKGKKEANFGAIHLQTQTETDNVKRMVKIKGIIIESLTFPNIEEAEAANLKKIVASVLPTDKTMLVSLDRILPYMEGENSTVREVEVNLDPPPIH